MTDTQTLTYSYEKMESIGRELADEFSWNTAAYDNDHSFVSANYQRLKEEKLFSAVVPSELGGSNWSYYRMCYFLKDLAKGCSSTALAMAMHQHLTSANVWKYKNGQGGDELLKKIAANQLVLVSTGAGDWLSSSGVMTKTEGGYIVTAKKHFASQSPVGNILVTSARFDNPQNGMQVLHFGIPFTSEGITVEDNWYAMGMRGTGSCSVTLNEVFIPETAVSLKRSMGEFHPFWNVVLTVAMPFIMSVYVGIAEKATEIALQKAQKKNDASVVFLLGEMFNSFTIAKVMWEDMIRLNNNYQFELTTDNSNDILMRKTTVSVACIQTVRKAIEIAGGQGYLQHTGLEKLLRDVLAVDFHPLPEKEQHLFTGNFHLGNKIIG